jgi:hypothetical protein
LAACVQCLFGKVWNVDIIEGMLNSLRYHLNSIKKYRKQDILVFIFALILIIIIFSIVIITTASPQTQKNTVSVTSPTSTPSQSEIQPTPQLLYDSSAGARLADKIINRQTLSTQDTSAKNTTITTILNGNSGVVYENSDVKVEYVKSMDLFMAEILSPNISNSKTEVSNWFINQGFSQQSICNLPVMFYLDPNVSTQLQGEDIRFSPLANGC